MKRHGGVNRGNRRVRLFLVAIIRDAGQRRRFRNHADFRRRVKRRRCTRAARINRLCAFKMKAFRLRGFAGKLPRLLFFERGAAVGRGFRLPFGVKLQTPARVGKVSRRTRGVPV